MMRALVLLTVVVLVQVPQQAPPTFRAAADAVTIEVSVRDRSRPVLGLTPADFLVSDDGVTQTVATVSYGVKPIDVTVVLDVSLSVTGQMLDRLRRAVRQLMTDRGPEDRLKLIMFNSRVLRVVDFTTDADAVDRAIRDAVAGGGSSVLDAVSVAAVSATDPERRHLVMIFTDGSDSSSVLTPEVVSRVIERTTSAVSAVVTLRGFSPMSNTPGSGTALLQYLARNTGGVYLPILGASQDLTAAFRRALDEFRSTYVLHYTPTGVAAGGFHQLTVSVRGRNGLTVKARRGYFR
jgi:Ca-activated chloride channel homolog